MTWLRTRLGEPTDEWIRFAQASKTLPLPEGELAQARSPTLRGAFQTRTVYYSQDKSTKKGQVDEREYNVMEELSIRRK